MYIYKHIYRGNSATVGVAAERAVSAALVASELYTAADKIVNQAVDETKVYIYTYICICIYTCIYIYVHIYIYIYLYT
jgi:metal-dependent amidase/aminoacylase/carboxypeptidase family protein